MATPTRPWGDRGATAVLKRVVQWRADRYSLAIALALGCGAAVRLAYLRDGDFPVYDGGMFYTMVRDLQRAGYALPLYTSYNQADIPFVYPPLGFYLAGGLADLARRDLFAIFRYLPLALSLLSLGAFAALARALLSSRVASAAATFAFALLPLSFLWQITGGGLTRALGSLCALLFLHQIHRLFTVRDGRTLALATLLAASTILSHPEAVWFAAYSAGFFWLGFGRSRRSLLDCTIVGGGALLLTAPWWLLMLSWHGLVFLRPLHDGGSAWYSGLVRFLSPYLTLEAWFPVIGMLALLGALAVIVRRQYFLPLWCLGIAVFQLRASEQRIVVPVALLAGVGVEGVLLPLLSRRQGGEEGAGRPTAPSSGRLLRVICVLLLGYATLAATAYQDQFRPLSADDRAAMTWMREHSPALAPTVIIGDGQRWVDDPVSEWFPALTGRQSIATPQGYEWLPGFSARVAAYEAVQVCGRQGSECLDAWSARTGQNFDFLYIIKHPEAAEDETTMLRQLIARDRRFRQLYDNPAASIYQRVSP